jgi:hypothetical protein
MTARAGDALSHIDFTAPQTGFSGAVCDESCAAILPSAERRGQRRSPATRFIPSEFAWPHERGEHADFCSNRLLAQALRCATKTLFRNNSKYSIG